MVLVSVFLLGVIIIFNLSEGDIKLFFDSMKFLFSVIAAYVGIRAVVNSSKSAKLSSESVRIATESIQITKEKELREQSSHPIILSLIETFPYAAPLYKRKLLYDFPSGSNNHSGKRQKYGEIPAMKKKYDEYDRIQDIAFLQRVNNELYNQLKIENHLEVINTGKGACVNLEYKFSFSNQEKFNGYSIFYSTVKIERSSIVPSYELRVTKYNKFYEISMIDNHMIDFVDKIYTEPVYRESQLEKIFRFQPENTFRNYSYLGAGKTLEVPLPNEFIILSKHYAIASILKNKVKNKDMFSSLIPSIEPLIYSELIKPVGIITLSYYDESLIRTGEYSSNEKTKMTYEVRINENSIIFKDDEFDMHLEARLIRSETNTKAVTKNEPI